MRKANFILGLCMFGASSMLMAQEPSVSGGSTNLNKPVHVTSTPKLQVSEKIVPVESIQPVTSDKQQPIQNAPSLSNGQPIQAPDHQQKEQPIKPQ